MKFVRPVATVREFGVSNQAMNDASSDDRRLVSAVLACEYGAFAHLVERHQKLVWHLLYRLVGDVEDTRELSQDVFLRVAQRLPQFRFESALGTWIGQIAFSIGARHLRRKRLPLADVSGDGEDMLARVDAGVDMEAEFSDVQRQRQLLAALDSLPPVQRALITLYHIEELDISQIASITAMPQGTIKSHLFRARKALRDCLHEDDGVRA